MSARLMLVFALVLALGFFGGWHAHRLSNYDRLVPKLLNRLDKYDEVEASAKELADQKDEAKGILFGQLVINEIRSWIRENALTDPVPLEIVSYTTPPIPPGGRAGASGQFQVFLSRYISPEQEEQLEKRVNDFLRSSLQRSARMNGLILTNTTFYATRGVHHGLNENFMCFFLNYQLGPNSSDEPLYQIDYK